MLSFCLVEERMRADDFLIAVVPSGYKELREILGLIIVGIIYFIYLPICLYGICKFNKYKDWIVMKKRYQWITVFILTNLVLSLMLLPLLLLRYSSIVNVDDIDYLIPYILYSIIVLAINIGWKILWRLWCYYYDIKWIYSISNKEWKSLIDKKLILNDWYLNNKDKYGKWNYFVIPYFLIVFIDLFFVTLWEYSLPTHLEEYKYIFVFITISIISVIPISLIIYLRFKTPKFNDNFAIREETKNVLVCICFGFILVIITGILSLFIQFEPITIILNMSVYFIWSTIYTIIVYFTTIWVIDTNKQWLNKSREESVIEEMKKKSTNEKSFDGMADELMDVIHDDVNVIPLFEILCNSMSYSLFIQHLSTEFNVESLLSLTEFIQYQQLIQLYCKQNDIQDYKTGNDDEHGGINLFKILHFDENIPKSTIVYDSKFNDVDYYDIDRGIFYAECKEKAYKLYEKYIKSGSKLEIMIDYDTKKIFSDLMENKDVEWSKIEMKELNLIELMYLFENICNQMYILMIDSYQRFVETNNYKKLNQCVFEC